MHRRRLAEKTAPELFKNRGDLRGDAPEPGDVFGVVAALGVVFREGDLALVVIGARQDRRGDAEVPQGRQQRPIEGGDAEPRNGEPGDAAGAGLHGDAMVDHVEQDLELHPAVRNPAGGEAARRRVQRDMPPMVELRVQLQPYLADDLQEQMKRFLAVLPSVERQRGKIVVRSRQSRRHVVLHPWPYRRTCPARMRAGERVLPYRTYGGSSRRQDDCRMRRDSLQYRPGVPYARHSRSS